MHTAVGVMMKDMKCLITREYHFMFTLQKERVFVHEKENHELQTTHLEPCHACIKFTFETSCNFNFFIVFEFLGSIESFSGNLEILTMYSKSIFCRKDMILNFDAVPKKLEPNCMFSDLPNQIQFSTFEIKCTTWNNLHSLVKHS